MGNNIVSLNDMEAAVKAAISQVEGQCYSASEALFHLMGGQCSKLTPIQGIWEGQSHWALRRADGHIIDLTIEQFIVIPDYTLFRGRGFLTKDPSIKAQSIINKVKGK